MVQLEMDDWYIWNNGTEMIWYEVVNARRKLDKIKQHYMKLQYSLTSDE